MGKLHVNRYRKQPQPAIFLPLDLKDKTYHSNMASLSALRDAPRGSKGQKRCLGNMLSLILSGGMFTHAAVPGGCVTVESSHE